MSEKTVDPSLVPSGDSTPGVKVSSEHLESLLTQKEKDESNKLNIAVQNALEKYAPPEDIDGGRRRGSRGSRGSRSAKKRLTKRKRNKKSHRRRKSRRVN